METVQNALAAVGHTLAMIFPLWVVVLVAALFSRQRRTLWPLWVMWLLFLASWLLARLLQVAPLVVLIPEPFDTGLFFLAGIVLLALTTLRRLRTTSAQK